MKHESSNISSKYSHRRAQKDLSEALEQLPSSKNLSEAHRVFEQMMINMWLSQDRCVQQR